MASGYLMVRYAIGWHAALPERIVFVYQLRYYLMAMEVKIYPAIATPPHWAAQNLAVEPCCFFEVINRQSEVEGRAF